MGHRALVAVERDPGQFDCYRSQWGGLAVCEADPTATVAEVVADERPFAVGVSAQGVLSLLDPRSEEALLVRTRVGLSTYLVRRLDVPTVAAGGDDSGSAPVRPASIVLVPASDSRLVERFDVTLRTAKGVLGDAVDAGLFTRTVAERYLEALVARHPDVPGGAVWLTPAAVRTDRE